MNEHGSAPEHEDDNHESENDQRDDNSMLAMAVVAVTHGRRNRRRALVPMHNSRLTGSMWVEEILNGHAEIIQGMISMKADTFKALNNLLGSRALLTPTYNMIVNEHVFIFLSICAQDATNRHISYLFQHLKETTSRWFYKVLKVICALKDEFIRLPDYIAVQPLIIEHGYKYRPWFDVRYPSPSHNIIV